MVNRTACANNNNFTALKLDNYMFIWYRKLTWKEYWL